MLAHGAQLAFWRMSTLQVSLHQSHPDFLAGESVTDGQDKSIAVIGRDRDVPALKQLGEVEVIARGPSLRRDRTYTCSGLRVARIRFLTGRVGARGTY